MALTAREVQVAAGDDHAIAVERKLVVDPQSGMVAQVENVAVAVQLEDGTVGVARQQRIHIVQHGGTLQRFSGYGQIKEAKEETSNKGALSVKLLEILCGTGACLLILLIFALLPVVAVVIGSVYLTRCEFIDNQSNTNVPIWLIVFGGIGLLQTFVHVCKHCCQCMCKSSEDDEEGNTMSTLISRCGCCCDSFFIAFQFVWMIVGSVWVFGVYGDYQEMGSACIDCCHAVPYLFSFVVLILIYCFGAVLCLGVCCCLCCALCLSDDS